jgi:iron complex outermembrane receptor protein
MLKSKAIWLGFCSLVGSIGLNAQDCQLALRGYVREEGSETPLAYASVFIREAGKGTSTDENGYFVLPNLCRNTAYTVEVRHLECAHFTEIVRIAETVEVCFHLHHDNTLPEVMVHEKAIVPRPSNAEVQVSAADLEATRGQNLGETLKKLPGVTLLNTGATISKPVIQGLHSNRIAIVNNGVALESQQWGSEHAPEIDPFAAEKISVVKGAAGVRYGVGAMAGAVVLEPAPLRETEGLGGWLSLGSFFQWPGWCGGRGGRLALAGQVLDFQATRNR